MDERKRQRCVYVTARQKKKLIELMTKHPELVSCKVTQDFNYKDSQKLWQNITIELNSMQGAKKTWRQWRKTWHDLRSKTKKRQAERNGEPPPSAFLLTPAEQEVLGIKNESSGILYDDIPQESTVFVPLDQDNTEDNTFNDEMESPASLSEPESPPEVKVFTRSSDSKVAKIKNSGHSSNRSKHSNNCNFNCDLIAAQEDRKLQLKEDYINFKKDYLRQKLKLIKEQTEALKSIAKELSK